jgi:putative methyltransferase (TIGR04325 family)
MEGTYSTYPEALDKATGYDSIGIALQVEATVRALLRGDIAYERDGTGYQQIPEGLMLRKLLSTYLRPGDVVVDFGGGLGGTFLNHADLFPSGCRKIVVEQPLFVERGRALAASIGLDIQFSERLDVLSRVDVVLASCVLQYLENYDPAIVSMVAMRPRAIILDRIALAGRERWHVQVCEGYGEGAARIPIRPLLRRRLVKLIPGYRVAAEWSNAFDPDIPTHRGFLFLHEG